jgi:predicted transcriptional regulator
MRIKSMSRQSKLLQVLNSGKEVTAAQIKSQFGIAHPASAIRSLREQGNCVYSNVTTDSRGNVVTKYRIGKPTKAMIAAAYRLGLFA